MTLTYIRDSISGKFAKGLLILLALSFVMWGMSDVFRTTSPNHPIKVGDTEYSRAEWNDAWRQKLMQFQGKVDENFLSNPQNIKVLKEILIQDLVSEGLLLQEAKNMGLRVSDNMVSSQLANMEMFHDSNGRFDKNIFEKRLKEIGRTEKQLVELVRKSMLLRQLIMVFRSVNNTPPYLLPNFSKAMGVSKEISLFELPLTNIKITGKPEAEELDKLYEINQKAFITPERRKISYVRLSSKDESVKVSQGELKAYYDLQKELFKVPQKRDVKQLIFGDRETAAKALAMLKKGAPIKRVARELEAKNNNIDLKQVTKKGFIENIGDTIFSLKPREVHEEPILSPLGWHVFVVEKVYPEHYKPLKDITKKLEDQLIQIKKQKELQRLRTLIIAGFESGNNLKEIARNNGFKLLSTEIIKGEKSSELPSFELVTEIFNLEEGDHTELYKLNESSYIIAEVNSIIPKKPIGREKAEKQLYKMWRETKEYEHMELIYEKLKGAQNSKKFDKLIKDNKLRVMNLTVNSEEAKGLDNPMLQQVLSTQEKQFTKPQYSQKKKAFIFAKINKNIAPSKERLEEQMHNLSFKLIGIIEEELLQEYMSSLRQKYKISISPDL